MSDIEILQQLTTRSPFGTPEVRYRIAVHDFHLCQPRTASDRSTHLGRRRTRIACTSAQRCRNAEDWRSRRSQRDNWRFAAYREGFGSGSGGVLRRKSSTSQTKPTAAEGNLSRLLRTPLF